MEFPIGLGANPFTRHAIQLKSKGTHQHRHLSFIFVLVSGQPCSGDLRRPVQKRLSGRSASLRHHNPLVDDALQEMPVKAGCFSEISQGTLLGHPLQNFLFNLLQVPLSFDLAIEVLVELAPSLIVEASAEALALTYALLRNATPEVAIKAVPKEAGTKVAFQHSPSCFGILLLAEVITHIESKPVDSAIIHSLVGFFKDELEEFQTIFSQEKSEAASCGGGEETSPLDHVEEEKLWNKSWLVAAGGKNPKGRVYGVGKLNEGYLSRETFTQQTSSSAADSQKIIRLEEEIHQSREEFRQSREENQ
ncbi:hypothetical protein Fmac_018991 [Flemingia macrophylla]|uniref:Uncharacterized protein n=1 Tax=Flemingia macrophylla TaxID=520843 RepID=A0ABD1M6H6_9FABA